MGVHEGEMSVLKAAQYFFAARKRGLDNFSSPLYALLTKGAVYFSSGY
ncbi:MAG: hypothetical protein LBK47_03900 [Prevotellaceae bacterium]|jgi:hypothetical protein|nr:hypothetical protein [Prevotellaceae bacterium]